MDQQAHSHTPDQPSGVSTGVDTLGEVPVLTTPLDEISMQELREYRAVLQHDEDRVSYWRRLVQGRLDIIREEKGAEQISTADLITALGATASGARRQQFLSIKAHDELPALPGLDEVWTSAIDPGDPTATADLVTRLQHAERQLSDYRRSLHERLDAATAELVRRYKANPELTDDLFEALQQQ